MEPSRDPGQPPRIPPRTTPRRPPAKQADDPRQTEALRKIAKSFRRLNVPRQRGGPQFLFVLLALLGIALVFFKIFQLRRDGEEPTLGIESAPVAASEIAGPLDPETYREPIESFETVLLGDSVHAFGDGILIASAFMADMRLGVVAALAVLAHEVPHHMGDLVVLRHTSGTQRAALVKVSLAGTVTALGGLVGYFLLVQLEDWLPYFLVAASSSFVYVALADLIPQLQKRLSLRETVAQVAWLGAGIALVSVVSGLAHSH